MVAIRNRSMRRKIAVKTRIMSSGTVSAEIEVYIECKACLTKSLVTFRSVLQIFLLFWGVVREDNFRLRRVRVDFFVIEFML